MKNSTNNTLFVSFSPAVSKEAQKSMRAKTRATNIRNRTDLSLEQIAAIFNPILMGWIEYYGKYCRSELNSVLTHFNSTLVWWLMHKYEKFKGHKTKAGDLLANIAKRNPTLFAHWEQGIVGSFA